MIPRGIGLWLPSALLLSRVPGSSLWSITTVPETIRSSLVHAQPSVTTEDTIPAPRARPWSLLGSLYLCILVFLELPVFLCMLCAVLWVNRPQRCCG
uniref:immunoglobulin superfamily, member 7 isoform 5 precursor n=1 Tax=Rattus norvegicus TaxID=10116 RepID=UPI0031B82F60